MKTFIGKRLSSDRCKSDSNGMVLSESRVEGGWLPNQRGVLGLDDDTVVK
jgi:hypothetical protein